MSSNIDRLISVIENGNDFLLTSHYAPDGDGLSSCIAFHLALKQLGKRSVITNHDAFVDRYRFLLDEDDTFVRSDALNKYSFKKIIILDTANIERIGAVADLIDQDAVIINIDHHATNSNFGTVNIIDPEASSTAQMLIELLPLCGAQISRPVADAVLSGILSDTGGLRFANTTPAVLEAVKRMLDCGSDMADISDRLFLRTHFDQVIKVNKICSEMVLCRKEKLVVAFNDQIENPLIENEPVLSMLASIAEAQVSVFIRKNGENFYKLSVRSKGDFNVSAFAEKWNGGGHRNAAGIRFYGSFTDLEKTLLAELKNLCMEKYGEL